MNKVEITRLALQERRAKYALGQQALKLLEKKQTVLLAEIRKSADAILDESESLSQVSNRARFALSRAEAVLGEAGVRSAALTGQRSLPVNIRTDNIMGVHIPDIRVGETQNEPENQYGVTNASLLLDEVVQTSTEEMFALIRMANRELRLRRLLDEYRRTFRRLNAIEHHLLPRINQEMTWIEMNLEEREQSAYFRLKRAKQLHEKINQRVD